MAYSETVAMKLLPTWKRPERWLAFVLTFFGICSFLAIVPVSDQAADLVVQSALVEPGEPADQSFLDSLRSGARETRLAGHWTSLLPPLVAIMVAVFFRTIVGALVSAFLVGCLLSYGLNPLATVFLGVTDFLIEPVFSRTSALIILFLFSLVGMVHVMGRSGGLAGLVGVLERVIKSRRQAKVAVGLGGVLLFFDHYSNAVVLGTTMQRLSDRWKLSREKLAYLVDSTTAPVAGVALLSTWVAYEAFLLGDSGASEMIGLSGYGMVKEILPYRFYCMGTLIFLFLSSGLGRDFGPMLKAERRAFLEGKLVDDSHERLGIQPSATEEAGKESPARWINAVAPIGVLVASIGLGIVALGAFRIESAGLDFSWGSFADWRLAVGAAVFDEAEQSVLGAMPVLLLASALGGAVAIVLPTLQRTLKAGQAFAAYARGLPTMWMAIFILAMTWSMQAICGTLGTAQYLVAMLGDGMPLWMSPLLAFLLSAVMSFAIGSSWGSMAILMPILLPLTAGMGALDADNLLIYLLTASAILDGAIFGDHCSPISDTTVLSSISTGCDHIAHVSTQLFYALVTFGLCCFLGYGAVALGGSVWSFYLGFPVVVAALLLMFGRGSTESESPTAAAGETEAIQAKV